jgi:hypothetical protein
VAVVAIPVVVVTVVVAVALIIVFYVDALLHIYFKMFILYLF